MASEQQIAANRTNAKLSTGPRTRAGKSRSRANSWRHGLSAQHIVEPQLAADFDELAKHIAREYAKPVNSQHVRLVAQAQVMILRARQVRAKLLEQLSSIQETNTVQPVGRADVSSPTEGHTIEPKILRALAALDRHEARALFRRQQGLKHLLTE
jgi:hypothetical protein